MSQIWRWMVPLFLLAISTSCAGRNRKQECDPYAAQTMMVPQDYSSVPILERPDRPGHVIGNSLRSWFHHP